jgi:hypothetical protein
MNDDEKMFYNIAYFLLSLMLMTNKLECTPASPWNVIHVWKKFPMEKHSSLFAKRLNDEDKSFVTLTTFILFFDVEQIS